MLSRPSPVCCEPVTYLTRYRELHATALRHDTLFVLHTYGFTSGWVGKVLYTSE